MNSHCGHLFIATLLEVGSIYLGPAVGESRREICRRGLEYHGTGFWRNTEGKMRILNCELRISRFALSNSPQDIVVRWRTKSAILNSKSEIPKDTFPGSRSCDAE